MVWNISVILFMLVLFMLKPLIPIWEMLLWIKGKDDGNLILKT